MCVFLDCFNYYSSLLFSIFVGLGLGALPTCFHVNHVFLRLQPGFWALLPSQLGRRSEPPGAPWVGGLQTGWEEMGVVPGAGPEAEASGCTHVWLHVDAVSHRVGTQTWR